MDPGAESIKSSGNSADLNDDFGVEVGAFLVLLAALWSHT